MSAKVRTALILLILIGMPIFAWYFLEKGSGMRKNAMLELKAKDAIDPFETPTENDIIVRQNFLEGKRWMIAIIGNDDNRNEIAQTVLNLYSQSKEEFKPNIMCVTGLKSGESMPQITQNLQFKSSDSTWLNCYLSESHLYPFTKEVFNIPNEYSNRPSVILVDEKLLVRNYYKLDDPVDVKKLVWQYPVFLSLKK